MYPVQTEGRHTAEHLISDNDKAGHLSREQITVGEGANLEPGTVLGKVSVSPSPTSAAKQGGNTGNGTMGAVAATAAAKVGVYKVVFTAATKFDVIDPDGFKLKSGTAGQAYKDDVEFTVTAGGNAFVADDGFDVTVPNQTYEYQMLDLSATNGMQNPAGVLYGHAFAADEDVRAVANVRDSVVRAESLVWPSGITGTQKAAALAKLAALTIIAR